MEFSVTYQTADGEVLNLTVHADIEGWSSDVADDMVNRLNRGLQEAWIRLVATARAAEASE